MEQIFVFVHFYVV